MRNQPFSRPQPAYAAESGSALPLVLITIAVLALVVATVTSGSSQELRMSRAFVRSNQAYYAALAGIQQLAARCASVGYDSQACQGESPESTYHGLLTNDHSAYQVAFVHCGTLCFQPPNTNGVTVLSIGCTWGTQLPDSDRPCDGIASDQGRRVIRATLYVTPQANGPSQVWFQLLPN